MVLTNGKLSRWDIFTAGIMQIWAIGIIDGREVSQRLQSLGFSTRVQINFSQQTITVSIHGGSGIVISQLFVHFFLVSSPLTLRIRRLQKKRGISQLTRWGLIIGDVLSL